MRPHVLVGFLGTLAVATSSPAYDLDSVEAAPPRVEVVSASAQAVTVVLEVPELVSETISYEGRAFDRLSIPGGSLSGDVGEPGLPVFTRLVAVPAGATVRARSVSVDEERRTGVRLAPMPAPGETEFPVRRESIAPDAERDARVQVGEPALMRDLRVVPVTFRPVRYSADRREVTIARSMRVELEFVDAAAPGETPVAQPSVPPTFDALYRELVVNYAGRAAGTEVVPGAYLLICPNDVAVISALQDLVDWRTRKGYPVILATTADTGTTRNQIKTYIQSVYNDPDVSLEYVVLVGDASGSVSLPTWIETRSGYGGEGDLPYSQIAGSDVLRDVHIGRLSVDSSTTLQYVVNKIVGYESDPYVADNTWFTRSCIVGDPSSSGLSCVDSGRWAEERLADHGYTESDTIFSGSWVSQMQTALNRGDSVFSYRGWLGMSGWSNGYTSILSNGWKMPFAIIITCDTGSFASGTARSEAFLRAWDSGNSRPRAAVGAIGMSTIGTHTRYNNSIFYGCYRGLLEDGGHTMGASLTRGSMELYLNYNDVEPNTVEIWSHWENLMGDPAVDVWTAYPEPLTVGHPANLAIGTNSVRVTVNDPSGPAEGAQVCLWKGSETWAVTSTDEFGLAILPVDAATGGDMLLTVTQHNRQPYLATIPVTAHTQFVTSVATVVDDDLSGGSLGNSDGIANPGETVEFRVQLENFGSQSAPAVMATLQSTDPYVRITDGVESFGVIAAGATAWCQEDFDLKVTNPCPNGHLLELDLVITSALESWTTRIEVPVVTADLRAQSAVVQDGNSRLDPGETAPLVVTLRNLGGSEATAVNAELISHSSFVTVPDPFGSFGTIGVGASASNQLDTFTVTAHSSTYEGYLAALSLVTTFSGGVVDTADLALVIGDRQTDDPVGPDGYGYLAYDNTDTGYPEAPVYSWIELDPAYGGDGTEVVLGDGGQYQDKSVVVTLPFPFDYYGETYTQATICSNGWVALGATDLITYRNWTIPGAGGPDAMLAPFWDNLYQTSGSKVFRKYDDENHRWIVEWSRMRNDYNGSTETFEVILEDPAYHLTDTGDGAITFQYETVTNHDPVNGYATVGIENPTQTDGILYTYFNKYSAGAATLAAGRAIRFMPVYEGPVAVLEGHVYNASFGDAPAEGIDVTIVEAQRAFRSLADGAYAGTAPPGTYTVTASHASFAPQTVVAVGLLEGQVTTLDFHLVDIAPPAITTIPHLWTQDTSGPYSIPVTIEEFSGLAENRLYVQIGGGAFTPIDLVAQGGNDWLGQIAGQPHGTLIRYYVLARDGIGLEATDPPGAPAVTYSFAVAPSEVVLYDEFEAGGTGWTVGAPGDDATTGVWERAEPVGTSYNGTQLAPEFDHTPNPGEVCFITENGVVGGGAGDADVDNGKTTLLSPVLDLSAAYSASVSYWAWYSNSTGSNPGEDFWIVEVTSDGSVWAELENTNQGTGAAWAQRTFLLDDYIDLTDQVQFRFIASDEGGGSLVEAGVDDFAVTGILDVFTGSGPTTVVVREDALDLARPNPFRAGTLFTYRLAQPGPVSLEVYDVTGRLVSKLFDGPGTPGQHQVRWDGRSVAGKPVAAGVYFVRMTAGEFRQVRRVVLLR